MIRMVEDSQEIYRLIGDVAEALRPPDTSEVRNVDLAMGESMKGFGSLNR